MSNPRNTGSRKPRSSSKDKGGAPNTWLAFAAGGGVAAVIGLIAFFVFGSSRGGGNSSATSTAATTNPPAPVAAVPATPISQISPGASPASPASPTPSVSTMPAQSMTGQGASSTTTGFQPTPSPDDSARSNLAFTSSAKTPDVVRPPAADAAPAKTQATPSYADLVEQTDKSVIRLNVETARGPSVGSGFVVSDSGIAITNYHVIEGGQKVSIEFEDGRKCGVDGFKLFDQDRDIAIIQLSQQGAPFIPIQLADHLPRKGEDVAAFGAPLGLSFTATKGTITNIRDGKELEMPGTYVQTDTSISPGNSGGPLVNMHGDVVGMNSFQLRTGQNLNFAVSTYDIREVLKASESQKLQEINPKNVPIRHVEQGIPKLADLCGTERADKLLAQISQAAIFVKPFEIDPTGRINEYMVDNLKKTVQTKLKVDLTRIRELRVDESVIIMGVMWSPPENEAQQERLASQLSLEIMVVMLDVNKEGTRTPSLVFKDKADLAVLSISALAQGNLTNSVRDGAKRFFDKFSSTVIKARKSAGVK